MISDRIAKTMKGPTHEKFRKASVTGVYANPISVVVPNASRMNCSDRLSGLSGPDRARHEQPGRIDVRKAQTEWTLVVDVVNQSVDRRDELVLGDEDLHRIDPRQNG